MTQNQPNACEFHLIKTLTLIGAQRIKASIKSISDLFIEGIDGDQCVIESMAPLSHNRYAAAVYDNKDCRYEIGYVDLNKNTFSMTNLLQGAIGILARCDAVLVVQRSLNVTVFVGDQDNGNLGIEPREVCCKSGWYISDRWFQDRKDDIYILSQENTLYSMKWSRILDKNYTDKVSLATDVEDFYATAAGVAILGVKGNLMLPGCHAIDLNVVDPAIKWSIVIGDANRWIVSGNGSGLFKLVYVNRSARLRSTMSIESDASETYMVCMKMITSSRHGSLILAAERPGVCHLISVSGRSMMTLIRTIKNLSVKTNESCKEMANTIFSVTLGRLAGELIVAGVGWIKNIVIKLR